MTKLEVHPSAPLAIASVGTLAFAVVPIGEQLTREASALIP